MECVHIGRAGARISRHNGLRRCSICRYNALRRCSICRHLSQLRTGFVDTIVHYLFETASPPNSPGRHAALSGLRRRAAPGGLRGSPGQSADRGISPGRRLYACVAPAIRRESEPRHPGLLGRRHPRRRVFIRRPRSAPPHRNRRTHRQEGTLPRRGQYHHRGLGGQLHRAGLRPVRRQALRHIPKRRS